MSSRWECCEIGIHAQWKAHIWALVLKSRGFYASFLRSLLRVVFVRYKPPSIQFTFDFFFVGLMIVPLSLSLSLRHWNVTIRAFYEAWIFLSFVSLQIVLKWMIGQIEAKSVCFLCVFAYPHIYAFMKKGKNWCSFWKTQLTWKERLRRKLMKNGMQKSISIYLVRNR